MMDGRFEHLSEELLAAAKRVKLLLMDCDGVLTDGRLYFTRDGEEMKVFHVRDGQGLSTWHVAGFESGIISGRGAAEILGIRAKDLGMKFVVASSRDKSADLDKILDAAGVTADEVAFIGDDIGDLPILERVGFPVAVCDAVEELKPHCLYVTATMGGQGAVRELTDLLLAAKKIESA